MLEREIKGLENYMSLYTELLEKISEENNSSYLESIDKNGINNKVYDEKGILLAQNIKKKYHQWLWLSILLIIFFSSIVVYAGANIYFYTYGFKRVPISESNIENLNGYWKSGTTHIYIEDDIFHLVLTSRNIDELANITFDYDAHTGEITFSNYAPETIETVQTSNNGKTLFFSWSDKNLMNYEEFVESNQETFNAARNEIKASNVLNINPHDLVLDQNSPLLETAYGEGTYIVGVDIPQGEYQVRTTGLMGNVGIYSNDTYNILDALISGSPIISNNYIILENDEYLKIDANTYLIPIEQALPYENNFLAYGTYKVGFDIPAGVYEVVSNVGEGYFKRVTEPISSESFGKTIESDNSFTNAYVTLNDGEYIVLDKGATIFLNN